MLKQNKYIISLFLVLSFSSLSADESDYVEFIMTESKNANVPYSLSFAVFDVISGFDNNKQTRDLCGISQQPQYIYIKKGLDCSDPKQSITLGIVRLGELLNVRGYSIYDTALAYRFGEPLIPLDKQPSFIKNYGERIKYLITVYKLKY